MDTPLLWSPAQQARLDEWGATRSVDVHCHCLPGLDDGPATLAASLDLCEALAADGITAVVASPHQLGGYDRQNTAAAVREAVARLSDELAAAGIPLQVAPGADVRVDERMVRLLETDQVLTVADRGRHLLLELPHELFVDPTTTIQALVERGVQPILTHPERHRYLAGALDHIEAWLAAGAVLQVTAGSLLGEFGRQAHEEAWQLTRAGLVGLVATDAHDAVRRPPCMTEALELLSNELGLDAARAMCLENPCRAFEGRPLIAVPLS